MIKKKEKLNIVWYHIWIEIYKSCMQREKRFSFVRETRLTLVREQKAWIFYNVPRWEGCHFISTETDCDVIHRISESLKSIQSLYTSNQKTSINVMWYIHYEMDTLSYILKCTWSIFSRIVMILWVNGNTALLQDTATMLPNVISVWKK